MNSIADALKNTGYNVPEAKKKVDSSKVNLGDKIVKCKEYINNANKAVSRINDAPDISTSEAFIDRTVLNYQRYVEALKDILMTVYNKENIQLSANGSLSEIVRNHLI
jgi:hypothetical protein